MEFNEKGNLIFNPAALVLPNAYFNQQPWRLYDSQSPCLSSNFELQDPRPKDAHATLKRTVSYTLIPEDVMPMFFWGSYPLDVRYGSVCNFLNLISLTWNWGALKQADLKGCLKTGYVLSLSRVICTNGEPTELCPLLIGSPDILQQL